MCIISYHVYFYDQVWYVCYVCVIPYLYIAVPYVVCLLQHIYYILPCGLCHVCYTNITPYHDVHCYTLCDLCVMYVTPYHDGPCGR